MLERNFYSYLTVIGLGKRTIIKYKYTSISYKSFLIVHNHSFVQNFHKSRYVYNNFCECGMDGIKIYFTGTLKVADEITFTTFAFLSETILPVDYLLSYK